MPKQEEIEINNLTFDNIHGLLIKNYNNPPYAKSYTETIIEDKKFGVMGKFNNGNRLVSLERRYAIFGVLDTTGNLLSVFFVYDFESCNYKPKHDSFFISAHETLTEVSSDGTIEKDYTR